MKKKGLVNGSKYEKAIEAISDDYASSLLVKRELEKITVSQDELKQAFEKIKPNMPVQLHLRQIIIADKQTAQTTLENLIKIEPSKLLEVFEQEAKSSLDTEGAKKGGDLGWLGIDSIVEPFASQLAGLKNGELSQSIVKGPNGWHILYLQERASERAATLEEAKARLESIVKYEKLKSIMAAKKEQLMKKYKVEMVK